MEPVQKRDCDDRPVSSGGGRRSGRHELTDALMRTGLVEVATVFDEHLEQVPLIENEKLVEAFAPYAAEQALTDRVRARRSDRCSEDSRANSLRYAVEVSTELVVAVANDEAGPRAEGVALRICCATQALFGSRVTPT